MEEGVIDDIVGGVGAVVDRWQNVHNVGVRREGNEIILMYELPAARGLRNGRATGKRRGRGGQGNEVDIEEECPALLHLIGNKPFFTS